MSFAEWSNNKKKKKTTSNTSKKTTSFGEWKNNKYGISDEEKASALSWRNDEIAPVKTKEDVDTIFKNVFQTAKQNQPKNGKTPTWLQVGELMEDGYDFGDISRSTAASMVDLATHVGAGLIELPESIGDTAATLTGAMGKYLTKGGGRYFSFMPYMTGFAKGGSLRDAHEEGVKAAEKFISGADEIGDKIGDETVDFVAEDLIHSRDIAKTIISKPIKKLTTIDSETQSIFGEKSDQVAESAGELLGAYLIGAGFKGIGNAAGYAPKAAARMGSWASTLTHGSSAFGKEAENAFNNGATLEEGFASALVSASAEMLTEKIGGVKFGGKTLTDAAFDSLSRKFSSNLATNLLRAGKITVDGFSEGTEEVISGYLSAAGQKLTYMEDKEIEELFSSEDALDSFIGGLVLGEAFETTNAVKQGDRYLTGIDKTEQKVVDKVTNDEIAKREKDGKKLTKSEKNKIYNETIERLEQGDIDIDTIEEVLGGKTYEEYKNLTDKEKTLTDEISQLENTPKEQITVKQSERLTEARAELKNITGKTELKQKLSDEVYGIAKNGLLVESYNERTRRGQAFEADLSQYKGRQRTAVERAVKSGILNNTNKAHALVDTLSRIEADKGIVFDYTNNENLKKSGFAIEGKTINGFESGGTVTLNVQSAKSWQSTVGHEITHVLKGTKHYDALKNALFEYANSKGELETRRANLTELYKNIETDIDEELTADLVGDYLFTDKKFINKLAGNRNLFQKVYDEVKYLYKVATGKDKADIEKVKHEFDKVWKEFSAEGVKADGKFNLSVTADSQGNDLGVAVQKRFANSKAVDENGNLKVLYHGTYNGEFYTFDKSKGSVEGDFGSGFYFTDNESDVENNYEGGGADFDNKVARRAEQIESEEGIDYHEAEARAREELYKGSNKHTVYLNIENPAIVGETNLLDYESFAEEYDREDYDSDEDYESDVEYLIQDKIDEIIWDIQRNVDIDSTDGIAEVLWNAVNEGGIDIEQLKANINELYLEDNNGNFVGNEVTRQIIESLGYDGIIDNTVSSKFNMNLDEGTTHYIVFKPNQIKSIDNQNPTDDPDIRKSLSNQGEQLAPIGSYSTPLYETALAPTGEDVAKMEGAEEKAVAKDVPSVEQSVDKVRNTKPVTQNIKKGYNKNLVKVFAEYIDRLFINYDAANLNGDSFYDNRFDAEIQEFYAEMDKYQKRKNLAKSIKLDVGYGAESVKDFAADIIKDWQTNYDSNKFVHRKLDELQNSKAETKAAKITDAPVVENAVTDAPMPTDADAPFPNEITPMTEEEANAIQDEKAQADAVAEGQPKGRKQLHHKIIDNIKSVFSGKGLDFDEVLKKAKNLSTFSTVDNTPQRVMEKALGYKEGQALADLTVNKVAQNETEGIKWLNSFTDRKNGLLAQLSKKYNIKPRSKESAAAQMYAEGFYVNENNDIVEYGDTELAQDFPDVNVRNNIKGLANDPTIRQIYDATLKAINESRARNAYPEIQRLDNYYLHFRAMNDTFSRIGLPFNPNDIRAKDLPTDLNGVTADLKPGQPYFASANHRTGKRTSFDLLGGLEQYLTSAKNQIYHIDDIQTLRALRNYIADNYGQANGLEGIDALTEEEAQEKIEQVYGSHLSTFAKFLNEEANVLAGKTALIDRGLEGVIGRRGMTFMDSVRKQVGSNMIGLNVSSSLTNVIAGVQAIAKTNKAACVKSLAQTTSSRIKSIFGKTDSFVENNPTIIRRKGAERFSRTPFQKVGDAGYVLMSAVDNVTTEFIVRAKYNEFIKKGMSEQDAITEADKWTSRLMGDRSLGQMPQIYNSKTLGLITQFQLEVRNQLDSQFYDTIKEAKASNEDIQNGLERNARTAAKVTKTFFELAVLQHLFGKGFEAVAGYNPAFDIISVLATALGFDDDEESEDTALDNIEQGFLELLGDLPYTSMITDGGRIPISSALPIKEVVTGKDEYGNEKSRLDTIKEALPYYLLPTGYGQIKKTAKGLSMYNTDEDHPIAGSYTDSGDLRFPVDDTFGNRLQAVIFGQWANENARDYIENGRKPLSPKKTQEFIDVELPIADYWKYLDGLKGLKTNSEKADYINSLDIEDWQKNLLMNNILDRKEDVDMSNYNDYNNYEEFDYAQKKPEKYAVSKAVGGYDTYKSYSKELYNIKADKDSNGKSISGSRKEKVVDYVNNLDIDYGAKLILFKSEYPSDDSYNAEIVEYLNNREDLSYEDRITIFEELGFTVKGDTVYWD